MTDRAAKVGAFKADDADIAFGELTEQMPDPGLAQLDRAEVEHDRPVGKEARRFLIQLSSWASHSMMGAWGASTNAMYERIQNRIELFASLALVTAAPLIFCGGDAEQ